MSVGAVNKQTGDRIPTAGMPAIDNALSLSSTNPVQNAIITAALANKQDKTDNTLQTTDKTVVGGINELKTAIGANTTAITAIKDGTNIDSFADVETALALKQNATDNNLETTSKTVVGAVNELKSGLTNVNAGVKLNTQDLTTVSRSKNLFPVTLELIKKANTSGTWSNNVYTLLECNYTVNTNSNGYVTSVDVVNAVTNTSNNYIKIPMPHDNNNYLFGTGYNAKRDIYVWDNTTSSRAKQWDGATESESSAGAALKQVKNVSTNNIEFRLRVAANTEAGSGTYYPMLCAHTETDPAFASYVPSVDSRLESVESKLPIAPTTDGSYVLTVTVASGTPTYSWVSD